MNYIVTTKTFTRISETSGTIQNTSRINAVEISNQAVKNTGVLLSPQEMFSFSDTTLYARCVEGGGAEIRVVPFLINFGVTQGGSSSEELPVDTQAANIIQDGWNNNYDAPDDVDTLVAGMMNDTDPIDTGDGWNDYLNELFNP